MSPQLPFSALPRSGGPISPGPPNFSDIEGGPHHPGAATPPGAGQNPVPVPPPPEPEMDEDKTTPGAATIPGAGPNPGVG